MQMRAISTRWTASIALLAAVFVAMLFAQVSYAALGAVEPISSPSASISADPQIDFDGAGTATAFYYTQESLAPSGIVARTKSGAGAWQPAIEISTGAPVANFAADVGTNGSAIVAWNTPSTSQVWAAYRASDGGWSAPFQIRSAGGDGVSVAIDSAGNAVVVWREATLSPGTQAAFARYRSATTNTWGSVDTISNVNFFGGNYLDLEADSAGRFVAAWSGNSNAVIDTATRSAGDAGTWGAPEAPELGDGGQLGFPKISADNSGGVAIVWVRQSLISGYFLRFVERPSGGSWSTPVDISGPDTELDRFQSRPQLGFDGAGNATAAWVDGFAEADRLRVATRSAGGAWSAPQTVHDEVGEIQDLSMGVDAVGNATAAWRREDPSNVSRIELTTRHFSRCVVRGGESVAVVLSDGATRGRFGRRWRRTCLGLVRRCCDRAGHHPRQVLRASVACERWAKSSDNHADDRPRDDQPEKGLPNGSRPRVEEEAQDQRKCAVLAQRALDGHPRVPVPHAGTTDRRKVRAQVKAQHAPTRM